MSDKSNNLVSEIDSKLQFLDGLLHEKRFKEALAEIRDLEATQKLDEGTLDFGHFCYYSAEVFRKLGDYQTALTKASKAFEIFKNTNENKRIAQIKYTLGNIYIALGDLKNAQEELHESLVTYKRIDDDRGRISVLCMLANISFQQSNYQIAIEYLLDSIKLCDKIGETQIKARGLGNLGTIYLRIGNLRLAEQNLLLNTKINEESNDWLNYCKGLLVLGYVCSQQRDFKRANKYFEQALKLIFENNYTREFAIYNEYAGELEFALGNYENAKNHYLNAIGIGEKIAPDSGITSQTYRLLAELQIAEKQYDEALSSCEKALKVATSLGEKIEIGAIHRALGQIYTAKKEKIKAKENFEKGVSILMEIKAKYELAKTNLEAGRSDAFKYLERIVHLSKAKEIFKGLDIEYYVGTVDLAFAEFFFNHEEYDKTEAFLEEAEKIFNESNETKDLELALELKARLNQSPIRIEKKIDPESKYLFSSLITQDSQMLAVMERAKKYKDLDFPILLEGETGTGKDLLAKVIHSESNRRNKSFVKVNCAAIPEALLEGELFGYRKGAFTGADRDKKGLFEQADGGTIFLNEIGDLAIRLQAKILDVIEDKEITRLGELEPRKVDFRVITASNKNLDEEVEKGNFRKDLHYRLNVVKLTLPSLRERKKDIPLLIDHFLKKHSIRGATKEIDFDPEMMDVFISHDWRGNVRELQNEIMKLIVEINGSKLDTQALSNRLHRNCNQSIDSADPQDISFQEQMAEHEKRLILKALEENDWIREKSAKSLRIPVNTLKNKIKKNNISRPI